eukprot:3631191-Pyramimonas_sp.AAC.2
MSKTEEPAEALPRGGEAPETDLSPPSAPPWAEPAPLEEDAPPPSSSTSCFTLLAASVAARLADGERYITSPLSPPSSAFFKMRRWETPLRRLLAVDSPL